jgi:hypothetical protein
MKIRGGRGTDITLLKFSTSDKFVVSEHLRDTGRRTSVYMCPRFPPSNNNKTDNTNSRAELNCPNLPPSSTRRKPRKNTTRSAATIGHIDDHNRDITCDNRELSRRWNRRRGPESISSLLLLPFAATDIATATSCIPSICIDSSCDSLQSRLSKSESKRTLKIRVLRVIDQPQKLKHSRDDGSIPVFTVGSGEAGPTTTKVKLADG